MAQQDVEIARKGYALLNEAYRSGDVRDLRAFLEEFWDPDVVLVPAGLLPESQTVRGWDGVLQFMTGQAGSRSNTSMPATGWWSHIASVGEHDIPESTWSSLSSTSLRSAEGRLCDLTCTRRRRRLSKMPACRTTLMPEAGPVP